MNKYEQHAEQQRRAAVRSSMMVWRAALTLVALVLFLIGLRYSASPRFFYGSAIAVVFLSLVLRQLSRRWKGKPPRAAQPDPRSTLKLN